MRVTAAELADLLPPAPSSPRISTRSRSNPAHLPSQIQHLLSNELQDFPLSPSLLFSSTNPFKFFLFSSTLPAPSIASERHDSPPALPHPLVPFLSFLISPLRCHSFDFSSYPSHNPLLQTPRGRRRSSLLARELSTQLSQAGIKMRSPALLGALMALGLFSATAGLPLRYDVPWRGSPSRQSLLCSALLCNDPHPSVPPFRA